MKPSRILVFIMRVLVLGFFVISLQVLWRGHQLPGGGFIGGLVAGSILALASWTLGVGVIRRVLVIHPARIILCGLGLALLSGLLSPLLGKGSLFKGIWFSIPVIEKVGTPLLFDLGVYLVVLGFCVVFVWGFVEAEEQSP